MDEDFPLALKKRRTDLGISMSEAGRQAGVHRTTWNSWEKGKATPEEHNHVHIEQAMRWARGSVAALLAGGEADELTPPSDQEILDANVLNATREELVQTAKLIEKVQGFEAAAAFLSRAYEMRGIEPSSGTNREVS